MKNLTAKSVVDRVKDIIQELVGLSPEDQIDSINDIKVALHKISPFKDEPVDCVIWVESMAVEANDYNPNKVAPTEMKTLRLSIDLDGYTQPVVTWEDRVNHREVVDGFHRYLVGSKDPEISKRLKGYLPVSTINNTRTDRGDRIASTIRHNRARGKHQVNAMSDIVQELTRRNWSEDKIARELGMDADEVIRLKQISGLAELFADRDFSQAWDVGEEDK